MMSGISKFFLLISIVAIAQGLSSCASLLGDTEPGRGPASEFDRGYQPSEENGDTSCLGRFCDPKEKKESEAEPQAKLDGTNNRVHQAIDSRDVILGMTRSQVLLSWGEPAARDVAGDGSGGHERWHYGSRYSLNGERVVIFEDGRVAGWFH